MLAIAGDLSLVNLDALRSSGFEPCGSYLVSRGKQKFNTSELAAWFPGFSHEDISELPIDEIVLVDSALADVGAGQTETYGGVVGVGASSASVESDREASVTPDTPAKTSRQMRPGKIEDSGEILLGARKHRYGKWLTPHDLTDMNEREKVTLVTKKAVWPEPINFAELKAKGVAPQVVLAMFELKRRLPSSINSPEHAESYVRFLTKVREKLAEVKTTQDFERALLEVGLELGIIEVKHDDNGEIRKVATTDAIYEYDRALDWRTTRSHLLSSRNFVSRVARMFPYSSRGNEEREWEFLLQRGRVRRNRPVSEDETEFEPIRRPHLEHLVREGLPHKRVGDVSPETFMEDFGFRGVQFGNWLPQDERQDVLNMGYDALCTLARVTAVPKRALSLEGELGLAFGARGISKAAAHYESTRKVINLTRMSGAGSLAHEWFHALDDWMLRFADKEAKKKQRTFVDHDVSTFYLSEVLTVNARHASRPIAFKEVTAFEELSPAMLKVMGALYTSREPLHEVRERLARELNQAKDLALSWVAHCLSEVHPEHRDHALRLARSELEKADDTNLITLVTDLATRSGRNFSSALNNIRWAKERIDVTGGAFKPENEGVLVEYAQLRTTHYVENAYKLDRSKSKRYWGSPCELAARAFEAYVFDRLVAENKRDDYLVHSVRSGDYFKARALPYPARDERSQINQAFDGLVQKLSEVMGERTRIQEKSAYREAQATTRMTG
jgi:hypothetical protein